MLKASKLLINYIECQKNKDRLAKQWGISLATIYRIKKREGDIDGSTVAKILDDTGFQFEAAFVSEKE